MTAVDATPRPGEVAVRDSGAADMAAICAIYGHYVANTTASFEEEAPDLAEMTSRRADVLARGLPYLVAEGGGMVVGFAYAGPFRQRSAYRLTIEDSIYVAPGWVGRGIGRALLAALIERCRAAGYRQMIAMIGGSDNVASMAVHASQGFGREGVLKGVGLKFGRWIDLVIMHRPLRNG